MRIPQTPGNVQLRSCNTEHHSARGCNAAALRKRTGTLFAILAGVAAVLCACANPSQPPGGPTDAAAPRVVRITPSSGSIGAKPKAVVFQFDEVVSETPKGATDLRALVFISPKSGDIDVDWRRSQIDVKPKRGWKPNTVYTVLLGSGVTDLRNNSIDSATRIVFSTGGPIPSTSVRGVVFNWQAAGVARKALVEAIAPDSTIYQTVADSLGRYLLEYVPPGKYTIRAIIDNNTNRSLERLEPWDTVSAAVIGISNLDLYAFTHDSIGLRISSTSMVDSNRTIRIAFDKPVSPTQALQTTMFVVRKAGKDSNTVVNVATVFSALQRATFDSLKRAASADSAARAQPALDTSLAARTRRDSLSRQKIRDSTVLADRQRRDSLRLAVLRGGRPLPVKDTTPQPKMNRPPLFTEVYITLDRPLEYDGRYRVTVRDVRGVDGTVKSPTGPVNVGPKPKPDERPRAPGDTAAVPVRR